MRIINARTSIFALALTVGLVFTNLSSAEAVDQKQLFERTKAELQKNVSESTLNELQVLVQAEPTNSDAHLHLGLVLDNQGLPELAAEQFELAVKYGADNADALIRLVKQEIQAGRVETGIGILNQGLKKFPNNAEILLLVGDYLYNQRNFEVGRSLFEKAYNIDPNVFGLGAALGQSVLATNPRRAAALATRDLEKRPTYFQALFVRGMAYKGLGQYQKASVDLEKCFSAQPIFPPVSDSLSQCYYWLGEYEKALRPAMYLTAATVSKDNETVGHLSNLLRILVKLPRDKVVASVNKIDVELARKGVIRPEFPYLLGKAFDGLNMPNAAIQQYQRSIAMLPDNNARAYYRLALDQELFLRDYESALKNYQTAYNQRPWDSDFTVAYMRIQDRLHNRNEDIAWRFKDWLNKTFNVN